MKQVFKRPRSLIDVPFHFCSGCHHGIIHRLVAENIDRYGLREKTIAVASVGCSVLLYDYIDTDVLEAPHGRAAAVATGVKRASPESFVFTYQGDGDLAAIGTAEIIHAGNRGECVTVIFVNNTVFGMTGGQMAPTTLAGQETTTTPFGRQTDINGFPIKMAEIMADLAGTAFVARVAVDTPKNLMKAKKMLRRALRFSCKRKGWVLLREKKPFLLSKPRRWRYSEA